MTVSAAQVGLRSERGPILLSLMLSTGLVAIDSTIIATAVPSIVDDLGGFPLFPWLFSAYLLAQAVSVPVYGKLADLVGRKPVMLLGIGLFLTGSVLCTAAWSMPALIAFRALQGLGAGAVQPMSLTIAGDIYTLAERGKVLGYIASVWAISSVVGPTLGGLFSQYLSWRWIFAINVPLCLLAMLALIRNFTERVEKRRPSLDYGGAALLSVGCGLLILDLLTAGESWPWLSLPGVGILAAGALMLIVLVPVERRAAEPVLPPWVFQRRILISSNLISAGVGAALLGLTSYVPTYAQDVLGTGPLVAGFAVAALTLGWPITASQSARLYLRIGFRATALIGCGLVLLGTTGLALIGTSVAAVALCCFTVGAGMGLVASPSLIAAQSTVDWNERGVVTGTNMFSRSIGSALGVAAFGAIANASMGPGRTNLDHAAAQHVFLAVVIVAVGICLAVAAFPHVDVNR